MFVVLAGGDGTARAATAPDEGSPDGVDGDLAAVSATDAQPVPVTSTAGDASTSDSELFAEESEAIPSVLEDTAGGAVTTGTDGGVYYSMAPVVGSLQTSSQIGRVDADWAFAFANLDDTNVVDLASGPGGGIWYTNQSATAPSIGHLVLDSPGLGIGSLEQFPVPVDQSPFGITTAGDGNLWDTVALAAPPRIGRLTPTGRYTGFGPLPASVAGPTGIVTGRDGTTFWVDGGINGVGHIGNTDLGGNSTIFPVAPLVDPTGLTIGPYGDVWFTSPSCSSCVPAQATNRIGRMTPAGDLTGNFFVSSDDAAFFGMTLGPDGNVWFSHASLTSDPAPNAIGQITPDGAVTLFGVSGVPGAIVGDRNGYVWWLSFDASTRTWEISRMLVARADLSLTKTVRSAGFGRGDEIVFDLVATNHGPTDAGNVVVTDRLPDGLVFVRAAHTGMWQCSANSTGRVVTCSLGRLADGASSGFSLITKLLRALAPGTELVNTATISSSAQDPDPFDNAATVRVVNPGVVPTSAPAAMGPTPPMREALPVTGGSPGALVAGASILLAVGFLACLISKRRDWHPGSGRA